MNQTQLTEEQIKNLCTEYQKWLGICVEDEHEEYGAGRVDGMERVLQILGIKFLETSTGVFSIVKEV